MEQQENEDPRKTNASTSAKDAAAKKASIDDDKIPTEKSGYADGESDDELEFDGEDLLHFSDRGYKP